MPGTVLNKLRLQKFIIDVAIFFIPRTERERARAKASEPGRRLGETETHRTETEESLSRGVGEVGQTAYVGAPARGTVSRRREVKGEKRKGDGETVTGGGWAGGVKHFCLPRTPGDRGPRLSPAQPRWKGPWPSFFASTLGSGGHRGRLKQTQTQNLAGSGAQPAGA